MSTDKNVFPVNSGNLFSVMPVSGSIRITLQTAGIHDYRVIHTGLLFISETLWHMDNDTEYHHLP